MKFQEIAHYYLGCKVVLRNGEYTLNPQLLVPIKDGNLECKPILRKLSDITIEEAAKVMQMVFHPNVEYPLKDYKLTINDAGNARITMGNDWYEVNLTFGNQTGSIWACDTRSENVKIRFDVYHYLLSRHFDLFNLIENEEAIWLNDILN